jgi:hypothetical protein
MSNACRHIPGAYNVPLDQLARLPYNASPCDTKTIVRRFVAADKAGLQ